MKLKIAIWPSWMMGFGLRLLRLLRHRRRLISMSIMFFLLTLVLAGIDLSFGLGIEKWAFLVVVVLTILSQGVCALCIDRLIYYAYAVRWSDETSGLALLGQFAFVATCIVGMSSMLMQSGTMWGLLCGVAGMQMFGWTNITTVCSANLNAFIPKRPKTLDRFTPEVLSLLREIGEQWGFDVVDPRQDRDASN